MVDKRKQHLVDALRYYVARSRKNEPERFAKMMRSLVDAQSGMHEYQKMMDTWFVLWPDLDFPPLFKELCADFPLEAPRLQTTSPKMMLAYKECSQPMSPADPLITTNMTYFTSSQQAVLVDKITPTSTEHDKNEMQTDDSNNLYSLSPAREVQMGDCYSTSPDSRLQMGSPDSGIYMGSTPDRDLCNFYPVSPDSGIQMGYISDNEVQMGVTHIVSADHEAHMATTTQWPITLESEMTSDDSLSSMSSDLKSAIDIC